MSVYRDEYRAHLRLQWSGELLIEPDIDLQRSRQPKVRTVKETMELMRRLVM